MLRHLLEWFAPRAERVSDDWIRDHERKSDRVEFIGVRWSWPVRKLTNEAAKWNASRLRRRA